MIDKTGLRSLKGGPLVAAITTVCASSFLLFGYDQGVMSGVVISQYWLDEMGNPSTVMTGTITALYDVGAVFGAIVAALTVERLGRKRSLIVGSILIIIGAILMGASVERIQMIVGRIVTGLGRCSRKDSKSSTNSINRDRILDFRCACLSKRDLSSQSTGLACFLSTDNDAFRADALLLD
jgi:hypothetical protein